MNQVSVWYKYVKYAVNSCLYPEEKIATRTGGRQRAVWKKKELNLKPVNVTELLRGFFFSNLCSGSSVTQCRCYRNFFRSRS